jgi:ribosomal protein S18 acetylase RimI-like enzyme
MSEALISLALESDLERLPEIERRATVLFHQANFGFPVPTEVRSLQELRQGFARGLLWVARDPSGQPVGFLLGDRLDGRFHIEEIDVLPERGRRGLGTALIRTACEAASAYGHHEATLCTYREVPWNAPYYRRIGFRDLEPNETEPELRARIEHEAAQGLEPAVRVAMVRGDLRNWSPRYSAPTRADPIR